MRSVILLFMVVSLLVGCGRLGFDDAALAAGDSSVPGDSGSDTGRDTGVMADASGGPDTSMPDGSSTPDADASADASEMTDTGPVDSGATASRAACCTAWCQDADRFGGSTVASEAYTASRTGCTSSTGCTCAVSAAIATTWTVITGDICDAHDFAMSCPGTCDGSQCNEVEISGRFVSSSEECVCVGRDIVSGLTQDVWSSQCVENSSATPFESACPP